MFPIHDRTRRRLCRAMFFIFGLLPTVTVLAWTISVHSSSHVALWRDRIAAFTGLEVKLQSVSTPRPGAILLEGLQLLDPQSGESVAAVQSLEFNGQPHGVWVVSKCEIDAARANRIMALLEKQLRKADEQKAESWQLAAREVTVRTPHDTQQFCDLNVQFDRTEASPAIFASLRQVNSPQVNPLWLRVELTKEMPRANLQFQLCTTGAPPSAPWQETTANVTSDKAVPAALALPCSLIASILHRENHFGTNSRWSGVLQALQNHENWQIETAGRLTNVDLHAAISELFPHQITGTAEITVQRASIADGRVQQCEGAVKSGVGTVGQSLLVSAANVLRMKVGGSIDASAANSSEVIPIAELSAVFKWDARGFEIHGRSGGETGAILLSSNGSALLADSNFRYPMAAIVNALIPGNLVQVPASQQAQWLMELLPMPDAASKN